MDSYINRRAEGHVKAQGRNFYSAEDADTLCLKARLPSTLGPLILEALERAAKEWLERSTDEAQDPKQANNDLHRLTKAAEQFSEALKEAGRDAWDAMIIVSDHQAFEHGVQLDVETPDELVPGAMILRIDDLEDGRGLSIVSVSDLVHLTDAVRMLSRFGELELHKPGKGRPESKALSTWVKRMHSLWDGELGQPFTAGHMDGVEATTHACAFCVEAFRFLDPDTPPQRVHTEMRKSIKFNKQHRNSQ